MVKAKVTVTTKFEDERILRALELAIEATALWVEGEAIRLVAVDVGAGAGLKGGIKAIRKSRFSWIVTDGKPYGIYVEFGRRAGRMPPPAALAGSGI